MSAQANDGALQRAYHLCGCGAQRLPGVWEEKETTINLVEDTCAGTHEKAPY
jgi:hypothetical protein